MGLHPLSTDTALYFDVILSVSKENACRVQVVHVPPFDCTKVYPVVWLLCLQVGRIVFVFASVNLCWLQKAVMCMNILQKEVNSVENKFFDVVHSLFYHTVNSRL